MGWVPGSSANQGRSPFGAGLCKEGRKSLGRLGVESVDLYQLHAPDRLVPITATMHAMRQLVDSGQVHQVGVSNFGREQWEEAEAALGRPVISNQEQHPYSLSFSLGDGLHLVNGNSVVVIGGLAMVVRLTSPFRGALADLEVAEMSEPKRTTRLPPGTRK